MRKADEEGSEKDRKSAAVTENTAAQEKTLRRKLKRDRMKSQIRISREISRPGPQKKTTFCTWLATYDATCRLRAGGKKYLPVWLKSGTNSSTSRERPLLSMPMWET